MSILHPDFLRVPIAHRAFHDVAAGRPENSLAAMTAAIGRGYGIEIDIQPSADGRAMVFHDYDLERLTGESGPIRSRSAAELSGLMLKGGTEGIPTLEKVLAHVAGRVPLLIEIKDQDGALGPDVGGLERTLAACLAGYRGPVAVMSFNPHSVMAMAQLAPDVPRGLTTCGFSREDWPLVPQARLDELRGIPDYGRSGACFISHQVEDLHSPRVAELKAQGAGVLCWTVKSAEQEQQARTVAHNITFEGYAPLIPAA
jgi:glycerophosphoryl diester phosphodiesterase